MNFSTMGLLLPWLSNSLLLPVLALFTASALANPVNLYVEQYPPYIDQQAPKQGFMTALVTEAFARAGQQTEVKFADWASVETAVDEQLSFSFMWTKNKARMRKWLFSDVIYTQQPKFLATKSFTRAIGRLHELRGIPIGLLQGYHYGTAIEGFRSHLMVAEHVSDYANINALLSGKQQLMVIDPVVASHLLGEYFSAKQRQQLKWIETNHFQNTSYYLVCAKSYGSCLNHIKRFNKGLASLKNDGTLAAAVKKAQTF